MKTMTATAGSHHKRRPAWWRWIARSAGAAVGLLTAGLGFGTSAPAEQSGYRSATAAPLAWQEFAGRLQGQFQQRLAIDDEVSRKLQDYNAKRPGSASPTLAVRAWILADGKIERIEFAGLDDAAVAVTLRSRLLRCDVGPPPPDMLQPLRLRLSLRPKDPPRQGE